MSLLHSIKMRIPRRLLQPYHFALAHAASIIYQFPSRKMRVIGVTGTKGKSSTVQFIAQLLEELGQTVGYTSTAGFRIAGQDIPNGMKMTMPGRFTLQKLLARMVKEKCAYGIVETSSQGLAQFRHIGITYDTVVFTNLSPEHIESHGGFENYKKAKGLLFATHPRVSVINADDDHATYFAGFPANRHVLVTWQDSFAKSDNRYQVRFIKADARGCTLQINGHLCVIPLIASYQWCNAVLAIATVIEQGFALTDVLAAAGALRDIPGRFERIDCGQDFTVIVDYAYEPASLGALLDAVKVFEPKRIIGVHGSAGGGRDVARRGPIGMLAGEREDIVIVTNEDPYDDDPKMIINQVAAGARQAGKKDGLDLFLIDDRGMAIAKAIAVAQAGDVVLITGKGAETIMAVAGGKMIPWDDRSVARDLLEQRKNHV